MSKEKLYHPAGGHKLIKAAATCLILLILTTFHTACEKSVSPEDKNIDLKHSLFPVTNIIDGDTIRIKYNGSIEKLRFIGINTPETKHPKKGIETYGQEAYLNTAKLLTGQSVYLEFDVQRRDKYGRLLAYVYLPDDTFVNALLLQEGYAQVMTVPPNVKYTDLFLELEQKARQEGRGLWKTPQNSHDSPSSKP